MNINRVKYRTYVMIKLRVILIGEIFFMKKNIYKYPVVFSIVVFALTMLLLWGAIYPLLFPLGETYSGVVKYTLTLILTIVFGFLIYKNIPFTLKCPKFIKGLFSYGSIGLIGAVMAFAFSFNEIDMAPSIEIIIGYVLLNLAIAFSEEFLFRGLILKTLLNAWKDKKDFIIKAVLVSSTIFGLRHLINLITNPTAINLTIGQVFFTFMAGFYLCALYLRTKNLWLCIAIHFIEDFLTGFWNLFSSSALALSNMDAPVINVVALVVLQSFYLIFGILMLIDKKWNKELPNIDPIEKA